MWLNEPLASFVPFDLSGSVIWCWQQPPFTALIASGTLAKGRSWYSPALSLLKQKEPLLSARIAQP